MRDEIVSRTSRALVAASFLLSAAGCAGGSASAPSTQQQAPLGTTEQASTVLPATRVAPAVVVEPAGYVAKTKDEPLSASGGKLTLPGLSSLKGSIGYPSNNADSGAKADLSASLTNSFNAPTPAGANIVYFLQAVLKSGQVFITFNSGTETAKISGSLLDPSDTYTLYVYVPSYSNQPVDTISAGSPNKKHVLEFTSPFSGATLPTNTAAILELGEK